jgi:hypothetical protein
VLLVAWLLVGALALLNVVTGVVALQAYGDTKAMLFLLQAKITIPRWFIGLALLRRIFAALTALQASTHWLPINVFTPDAFIRCSGILAMGVATIAMLTRWPGRLSVVFPTLVPLWFMFSTGYLEYYPLVAWGVTAYLGWLYIEPTRLEARSPYAIGAIAAVLPLLYLGFGPLGALLMVTYLSVRPRSMVKVAGAAAVSFLALVSLLWEGDIASFVSRSYRGLEFIDAWTFKRYVGRYNAGSNFFRVSYALSPEHLWDLLYMYLFGGGLLFLPLLAVGGLGLHRVQQWKTLSASDRRLLLLATALVGFYLYYTLFFVARLGPRRDIDLYFSTFFLIAFFAGHTIDRLISLGRLSERSALVATALVLGSVAAVVPQLVFSGLPTPPGDVSDR